MKKIMRIAYHELRTTLSRVSYLLISYGLPLLGLLLALHLDRRRALLSRFLDRLEIPQDDAESEIVHAERVLQLRHEQGVGVAEGLEAPDESRGDGIVVREEDVAAVRHLGSRPGRRRGR
mgnify:CR=1 FL=1